MEQFTFVIPCLFGLEGLVGDEVRRMGMAQVAVADRRVSFTGTLEDMVRANLCLRMGERVLISLARFPVHTFEDLYQGVRHIPWENWVGKAGAFPVKGYSLSSQLHSVPDCQAIVKKAAVDRLSRRYGLGWLPETGPTYPIHFSILKDQCEILLDTSGQGLHKRGYRAMGNEAPLHETMAAALVQLARYRGKEVFWDPFCGSGTIVIEAALTALNRAPGLYRSFGAQTWPQVPASLWTQAREQARDQEFRGEYTLVGSDVDPAALNLAIANSRKAGADQWITFRQADARRMPPPADRGILVSNPPYGQRMLETKEVQDLYRALGRHLANTPGWKKYLLSSEPELETWFGSQAKKKRKLYNGRLQCNVYMYF